MGREQTSDHPAVVAASEGAALEWTLLRGRERWEQKESCRQQLLASMDVNADLEQSAEQGQQP